METTLIAPPKTLIKPAEVGRFYTPEEYLALEEKAETKSEYLNGVIRPMAGASRAHSRIVMRIAAELVNQLDPHECTVFSSDTHVRVALAGLYAYPDVSVACGEERFDGETLPNPSMIIEVLSDSTEAYDRGNKFARYQQLDSLTDYILVSQNEPRIEHYARQTNAPWLYQAAGSLDATLTIASHGVTLHLENIYRGTVFPEVVGGGEVITDEAGETA